METRIQIAVLLRFKENPQTPTVESHNEVFRTHGNVWLGKFGVPIRSSFLKFSSDPNVECKIILVRGKMGKQESGPQMFIADVGATQNKRPSPRKIPGYYRSKRDVGTWFCLTSEIKQLNQRDAKAWVVASSGKSLLLSIRRCPRTFFLLVKKTDFSRFQPLLAKCNTGDIRPRKPRKINVASNDQEFTLADSDLLDLLS